MVALIKNGQPMRPIPLYGVPSRWSAKVALGAIAAHDAGHRTTAAVISASLKGTCTRKGKNRLAEGRRLEEHNLERQRAVSIPPQASRVPFGSWGHALPDDGLTPLPRERICTLEREQRTFPDEKPIEKRLQRIHPALRDEFLGISAARKPRFSCRYSGLSDKSPMIHTTVRLGRRIGMS